MDLNQRFWEIDVLRGLAIVMMVTYHFLFDISFFGVYPLNVSTGILWWLARLTAFVFLFLVGVSLVLSHSRAELKGQNLEGRGFFFKYLKRGVKIFLLGILISMVTWIFIPQEFIVFGVLHFIGIAIILEYPFLNKKYLNLALGIFFIILGLILAQFTVNYPWLLWLGMKPVEFVTVDYFPLLPWLGVVSLGLFAGQTLYQGYKRKFHLPDCSKNPFILSFSFLGRHSLLIYLLHQPLIIIILYLLGALDLGNLFYFLN
ncbi:MAG: hypothetical protein PWQ15_53 [Methanobacterium sp.]|jgi:uncharacterized membrane protein|uniref:heparan-alpha-glucosaminide N-acetyltransferase n=1 Tax=Methanobacterium sp. TaxID=2164 RepID=UPI0024AB0F46|nr:heparan-alpha-glucosaminide N-acetyltransferase [Methanobacterium sp.]MDI3548951.1 hypothetical protein [Methanobacterium sp.]